MSQQKATINVGQTMWDQKNNILQVQPKPRAKLRGFILNVLENEEELIAAQNGTLNKIQIAPVLAANESQAMEYIQSQGKIVTSIVPMEILEAQVQMLKDIAAAENIELIKESDLFLKFSPQS